MTDFYSDLRLAKNDVELARFLKHRADGKQVLSALDPTIPATRIISAVSLNLFKDSQKSYVGMRHHLHLVFVESEVPNAFATWTAPGRDWVVICTGLLDELAYGAERLSNFIGAHKNDQSVAMRTVALALHHRPSNAVGGNSQLFDCLFAGGFAFFAGHEVGHHFDGHEAFFGSVSASAKGIDELNIWTQQAPSIDQHARELGADVFSARKCIQCIVAYTADLLSFADMDEIETAARGECAIYLAAASLFTCLFVFRPGKYMGPLAASKTHPSHELRAVWLANFAICYLREAFPAIAPTEVSRLVLQCLQEAAALAALDSRRFKNLLSTGNYDAGESAIRASGIRRVIFDDEVTPYIEDVTSRYEILKKRLAPCARGTNPMPISRI